LPAEAPPALAREFVRYFWAGCLVFGLDLAVLVSLTELAGLHYLVANLFGFAVGLTAGYLLSIRWVFARRRLTRTRHEFMIFFILTLLGLALNQGLLWAGVEFAGLHYTLAKVVATGAGFVANFALKKAVLFR
jgi:putative flippase GtrA